jgi:hypothetical protein
MYQRTWHVRGRRHAFRIGQARRRGDRRGRSGGGGATSLSRRTEYAGRAPGGQVGTSGYLISPVEVFSREYPVPEPSKRLKMRA